MSIRNYIKIEKIESDKENGDKYKERLMNKETNTEINENENETQIKELNNENNQRNL